MAKVQPTLAKCLADAVAQGRLSQAQAQEAQAKVEDIMLRHGLPETEAGARAAEQLALDAARHRRRTAERIIATDRTLRQAESHPRGFVAGVAALLARDAFADAWAAAGRLGYSSVESRAKAVKGELHARFLAGLDAYRSRALGLGRDLPGLRQFIRSLYGEAGDPVADAAARAWNDAADFAVKRFNAAGGDLPPKANWRLPQHWDHAKVKAGGRDAFVEFMRGEAEAGRLQIIGWETGEALDATLRNDIINKAWERINSNGLVDLVPGQVGSGASLATRHNAPRAFEWTSAEAWLRFNDRYGVGDAGIFDLLTGHLDGMARDIGMLEILGPNPQHLVRLLIDTARQREAPGYQLHKLAAIWDHVSGAANSPVSEWLAGTMRGIRSWLTAAQLGSAVLSSVTDFATLRSTAAWNGISAAGAMRRYLGLLNPADDADRKLAVRLGLIADGWAQRALGAMRDQADIVGADLAGRVAEFTMRASGMNAHTQAARWAFGMEFLGHLADRAERPLAELEPELRRAMGRYGIDGADWDAIRTRGLWQEDGARFIHPEQIVTGGGDRAAQDAASRLLEMVQGETSFAVVEPGALERAILLGRSRGGTGWGEFTRSIAQYKTFPISMLTRHGMRGLEAFKAGDRGRYMVATAVSLTLMGAAAIQLKAVAQGRDPRDMATPSFWGAAFFQGGGAGILGDFLNAGLNRANQGFYMTVVGGPTAGLIDDLARLTGGNMQGLAEGKDTNFGRELARFVKRNAPGTSLWYGRLALDRLMWDRLQELADPDAARSFQRMEDRARRDFGQEFWWRPGQPTLSRAPSLETMLGAEP